MASNKKPKKKYTPKDFFLPPIEIDAFIYPVENIIKESENGDIFYNDKNEPLISLKGFEVEEMARKGHDPYTAENMLRCFSEIVFQTAIYAHNDNTYIDEIIKKVQGYDRLFVQPIRLHSPLQQAGIKAAKDFCLATRQMLKKTKSRQFFRVQAQILDIVQNGEKIVTNYEMRDWLIIDLINKKSSKAFYLIERVVELPREPSQS